MPSRFNQKEQSLILKLFNYFSRERDAGMPLLPLNSVYNRVADALDVSIRTIQKIVTSGIERDEEYKIKVNAAIVSARGSPIYKTHEHAIRTRVYAMYSAGEHVTIRSLQKKLKDIDAVEISLGSLAGALAKLKFKWRKCSISNRKYLMEQPSVTQKRTKFLREYTKIQNDLFSLKPVVLDETWIFSKGAFRRSWQDETLKSVRKKTGEGVRYIILHAVSEDGFVENASLVFKSGSKSGDYHDSMNCINFEKLFTEKLLPNLPEPLLIIMDNASYHSGLVEKIPNQSWTKQSLLEWLEEKQIHYPKFAMKDQLWDVIKRHLPEKIYRMDELALQQGHRVLRLPPYHCHYNAIEMVWSDCKRYYDSKITSVHPVTAAAVINVWNEALAQVTVDKCKSYFRHTNQIISSDWEKEKFINASHILSIIINLNESDSDYDDDDDDDDDFVSVEA